MNACVYVRVCVCVCMCARARASVRVRVCVRVCVDIQPANDPRQRVSQRQGRRSSGIVVK